MKIITQTPGPGGAYPPIQEGNFASVPEGMAIWPEDMSTDMFYTYSGFVHLGVTEQKIVTGQEEISLPSEEGGEPVVQLRDIISTVLVVTSCQPNTEAWEAWKAAQPEEPAPEPEPQSDMDLMAAAYREGVSEA